MQLPNESCPRKTEQFAYQKNYAGQFTIHIVLEYVLLQFQALKNARTHCFQIYTRSKKEKSKKENGTPT